MKVEKNNVQDIWPLRPLQQGMLFHYLQGEYKGEYLERLVLTLQGQVDNRLFNQAWLSVYRANDALRSVFKWEGLRTPVQLVLRSCEPLPEILDFTGGVIPDGFHASFSSEDLEVLQQAKSVEERMQLTLELMGRRDRAKHFDLTQETLRIVLCKFDGECRLFLTFHHILLDGWSLGIMLEEWLHAYRALAEQQEVSHPAKPGMKAYLAAVKSSREPEREAQYWSDNLRDYEIKQTIQPFYKPRRPGFKRISLNIPETAASGLRLFCQNNGMSLATLMNGAWGLLLQRFKHVDDIVFGTTVSGRGVSLPGIERIAGLLINTVPLRLSSRKGESVRAYFSRVQAAISARRPHEMAGLAEIRGYAGIQGTEELFDTLLVMENYPLAKVLLEQPPAGSSPDGIATQAPLSFSSFDMEEHTHYPLTLLIRESGGFELDFIYDQENYEYFVVNQMSQCFVQLLHNLAARPDGKLSDIRMAEPEALKMNGLLSPAEPVKPFREQSIPQWFSMMVRSYPQHIAIIHEEVRWTYAELDRMSDRVAAALIRHGAGPEQCIGIQSRRSPETIMGLLAILKSGAAYVPLHPDYPEERIRFMIEDSGMRLMLSDTDSRASFMKSMGVETLCYQNILENEDPAPLDGTDSQHSDGHRLACIVYTSGSTGRPKGVMIEHRGIVRLVKHTEFVDIGIRDVILPTCPFEFDVANFEIWGALLNGAALYLLAQDKLLMPQVLKETLLQHKVSLMWMTTPLFNQLASVDEALFRSLRYLIIGGDTLSPTQINKVRQANPALRLVNGYGPSENSVLSTTFAIEREYETRIPIGKPVTSSTAYILDRDQQFLPVGAIGELCVGLEGVARGYLNNPELTEAKFIPDPLYPEYKMYRTGDLARWLPDGNIDFLGRADNQVKVRGYRIELQEIELELGQLTGIQACTVIVTQVSDREKELAAYFVANDTLQAGSIRKALLERLPAYAVPTRYMQLAALPLTINGKVDKQALRNLPFPSSVIGGTPAQSLAFMEITVLEAWKEALGVERIGLDDPFFDIGGNSLLTIRISDKLRASTGIELSVTDLFRYPTVRELAAYLSAKQTETSPNGTSHAGILPQAEQHTMEAACEATGDIAVIGLAARFPGASDPAGFWHNLREGKESISFFSDEELRAAGVAETLLRDSRYVKAKGMLEDIEYFDAELFHYSPQEAELMDPQLRILHELAWASLEDAGYDPMRHQGAIGMFVGATVHLNWVNRLFDSLADDTERWRAANLNVHSLSMPISYRLNLKGPSLTVETACSSSLVAVHLACSSLLRGESDLALAGGVSISVPKKSGYTYQEGMIKSPDGHCKAFDADAQGTVSGDGAGLVVLKRLDLAVRDGDHIYAVVKGSAINNDGTRKAGFTAPSVQGQQDVVAAALEAAAVPAASISYIETHGTGTPLGDPIEIEALTGLFPASGGTRTAIGSVKTNIGHLDAAAGIAGFIKTVLALHHKQLPPSLHYKRPNQAIGFDKSSLVVNATLQEWLPPEGSPRRAGVSSFGIGGTNAHVILEEAPLSVTADHGNGQNRSDGSPELFLISAATEEALLQKTEDLLYYLDSEKGQKQQLGDIAYTLNTGRQELGFRVALVAADTAELAAGLRACQRGTGNTARIRETVHVVFAFPGQGAQHAGMARYLYDTQPLFRCEMDRCLELASPLMEADLRSIWLSQQGSKGGGPTPPGTTLNAIDQTEIAQPLLFMVEYALARLLQHWGISQAAMIGHSLGEYTAACIAGVMTLAEAVPLVIRRSSLMQQMEQGEMISVSLRHELVLPLLDEWPDLSVAATNSPELTVVSGPAASIRALTAQLQRTGQEPVRLQVSHAFHSAMMEPMLSPYGKALQEIALAAPAIPYISNVTGEFITAEQAVDPEYYVNHVRQTVRFMEGAATLAEQLEPVFLEVGPGRTLGQLIRRNPGIGRNCPVLGIIPKASEAHSADIHLLQALGDLWMNGVAIHWERVYENRKGRRVSLPVYPFEKQYYWKYQQGSAENVQPETSRSCKRPVSEWAYVPDWREVADSTTSNTEASGSARSGETVLLFTERSDLAEQLATWLEGQGDRCIRVYPEGTFRSESADIYTLDPGNPAHYSQLFKGFAEAGTQQPGRIIYLWSLGLDQADTLPQAQIAASRNGENLAGQQVLNRCLYSVLELVRAAGVAAQGKPLDLTLVTNQMERVQPGDSADPLKATLLGAASVIPLEYPQIRVHTLDLDPESAAANPGQLLALPYEVSDRKASPLPVRQALRRSRRYEHGFTRVILPRRTLPSSTLRKGAVYLITGGLGGIGLALAGYLAAQYQARLVLVGRQPRPVQDRLEQLCAAGAQVHVEYADVADKAAMERVILAAVERFGPLDGVFHAAGVPDSSMIHSATREQIAAVLRPKIAGTMVLYEILADLKHPPAFLLLFSSISGTFGAFGQSGYAAANAFMDGFARAHAGEPSAMRVVSMDWDTWSETGMAVAAVNRYNGTQAGHDTAGFTSGQTDLPLRTSHPLLTCRSEGAGKTQTVYVSRLSSEQHWILDGHRMLGTSILPGTGYIEILRASFEDMTGETGLNITELFFVQPLVAEEVCELRTEWSKSGGGWEFSMSSIGTAGEWTQHAKGHAERMETQTGWTLSHTELEELHQNLMAATVPAAAELSGEGLKVRMQYGPHWNNVRRVLRKGSEAVAELSLPDDQAGDSAEYGVHPALMDRATSLLDGQAGDSGAYLPFAYKHIRIHRPFPPRICAILQEGEPNEEARTYVCRITDPEGRVLMEVGEYVMRKVRDQSLEDKLPLQQEGKQLAVGNFRLGLAVPGELNSLHLLPEYRLPPGPGEVEIRVAANGLNFKEVLYALGVLKLPDTYGFSFGLECAGTVTRVGAGVTGWLPGDEVMAIAGASLGKYARVAAGSVVRKPSRISFAEAATVPIAFMTAYYALVVRGQLSMGEKVLIHTATGGVGLAAVQIAKWIGAEIYATAGTEEKRAYLRSLGITQVYSSRDLGFADQIRESAGAVDVVLNSLTGAAVEKGLSLLAPHGRFLEMGVKDIMENSNLEMRMFEKGISLSAISMDSGLPGYTKLFREIARQVEEGTFTPLPVIPYRLSAAEEAFRYMASARHIGKIVITQEPAAARKTEKVQLRDGMTNAEGMEVLEHILSKVMRTGESAVQWLLSTTDLNARHSLLEANVPEGISPANTPLHSGRKRKRQAGSTEYAPPVTETQKQLAELFMDYLELTAIGLHDNFFEAGASSLDLIQINARINALSAKDTSIVKMYSYPTIHLLDAYLFADREDQPGNSEVLKDSEDRKRKASRLKTLESIKGRR
ncbi:amino acid adenylation domain-containing protein [Paenibacillus albidus]|uniref:non-ribosomal peptide synthetase/type I polyketide synthase n=1 Tax=Paenibacillus albidus TaxID=2041023 RepID=UPI001BED1F93|nr:non-ribosomal peptide synthetase/type I polyketide synthase [Paenibacillus albidus]MBT2291740.1 amino acid adenylation domain-containing protein [Paenibacillus albidus]